MRFDTRFVPTKLRKNGHHQLAKFYMQFDKRKRCEKIILTIK